MKFLYNLTAITLFLVGFECKSEEDYLRGSAGYTIKSLFLKSQMEKKRMIKSSIIKKRKKLKKQRKKIFRFLKIEKKLIQK